MLKKSLKYFAIATINATVLTALLALWTDKLELTFNNLVRPIEFLKIIGFTILSLIAMRLLVIYFRKKNITSIKTKIKFAAILTFLITSYLYLDYTQKAFNNLVINGQFRNQIVDKIRPANGLANGTKAEHLTIKEYQEISRIKGFPSIPVEAANIEYIHEYDGFLPDYAFTLIYDLPKEMKADTINYQKGDFSQYQTFEIIDNKKRVIYSEGEQ